VGREFRSIIDIYAENPIEVVGVLRGAFCVEKARATPAGVVYARVLGGERVEVDVTPLPSALERVEGDYRLVDGGTIVVWTLAPEALLLEKARAYVERCKARDLYDVYYLLDLCRPEFSAEVSRMLLERLCEPSDRTL
jgi:predicted nucleotidyltransferase component of viral defense system